MGQDDEYRVYFVGPDGDWKCEYINFGGSGLLTRSGEQIIGFLEICSMNLGKSTSSCINKFKPNSLFVSFCTVDGNGLEMEFQSDEHRTAFVDQFECAKCQCRSKAVEENSSRQSGSGNSGYRASMRSTRSSQQSREGNWARIVLQDDDEDSGSTSNRESSSSSSKDSKPRKSSSSKSRKSSSSKSRKSSSSKSRTSKQSRKSSGSKSGDSNDGGSGDSENGGSENPKDDQSGDSKEGDDEKPRQEPRQKGSMSSRSYWFIMFNVGY